VSSGQQGRGAGSSTGTRRVLEPVHTLLGNRSLTWLLGAFSLFTVAEWGYVTALAIYAFRQNGAIAVGLVGLRLFFAALSSLFTVSWVERHSSRTILTGVAVLRLLVVAASAALAATGAPLAPLLVLVGIDAVVSAPYRPAQSALLPVMARTPTELAASAAGLSTVKTISQALGALLAGSLLTVISPASVFSGAAVMFAGVGALTIRFPDWCAARGEPRQPGAIRRTAQETFAVIRSHRVTGIVVVSALRTFVRGMWVAIAVIVSLRLLHAGSAGVGLLMLAAGIGSLTAIPLVSTLIYRPRLGTTTAAALIACGVPLAVVAGIPLFGVAFVVVAAWGVGMVVADVATSTLLYRLLDAPVMPRVTGAIESAKLALEGLGAFVGPALVSWTGVRPALLVAAVPLPVVVVAGWGVLHRVDRSAGERHRLLGVLHRVPCLQPLDVASLEALAGGVSRIAVPKGTNVVRQGDRGDNFYVVVTGTADVVVDGFLVGDVGPGGSFGERALLRDVARMATVVSRDDMQLLAVSREDFVAAVTNRDGLGRPTYADWAWSETGGGSRRDRIEALCRVSLLSHLDSETIDALAAVSVVERWAPNVSIVRRGDEGDRFFVLLDGRAVVSVEGRVLAELCPGDHFGEIAILHDVPRQADVVTASSAATLSLHRDALLPAVRSRLLLG
jgi:CRP-like cAMP-binding protein